MSDQVEAFTVTFMLALGAIGGLLYTMGRDIAGARRALERIAQAAEARNEDKP